MDNILNCRRFNDYLIYEDGTVKSLLTGKLIRKRVGPQGYYQINLCINGKCKTYMFHRLMAEAFIDNSTNLPCVNHIDGNKLNNALDNLEWTTYSENSKHALRTGLTHPAKGKNTKNGRFSDSDIKNIRGLSKQGKSQRQIAALYQVSKSTIQQILEGRAYSWVD